MTSRTRSNTKYDEVLDFSAGQRVSRKLELSPNASPCQKRDYYLKVFKGPPNAQELMQRTVTTSATDPTTTNPRESSNGPFRLLQFNASCTNCENIFKAVLFLRNRVPEKAHLQDESFVFGFTKDSVSFKDLAAELASTEPSLRSVTPLALLSLYERIVKERKALDDFLVLATEFTWTDTRLSDMSLELVETDRELRERVIRQQAARSMARRQQAAGAEAVERQLLMSMPGIFSGRKRVLQEDDSNDGTAVGNGNDDINDDLQSHSTAPMLSSLAPTSSRSDARHEPGPQTDDSSSTQSGLRQRAPIQSRPLSMAPVQMRQQSSASESTDADPPSPTQLGRPSTFLRPTPKFKRRAVMVEDDRISALIARVDELESQNRQLRMDIMQYAWSYGQSVSNLEDQFQALNKRTLQKTLSVQEQVQDQKREMQRVVNQFDLDLEELRMKARDHDNKIKALQNAKNLHLPFT